MESFKNYLRSQNMIFELQDFGVTFDYQGGTFAVFEDEDDKNYFQLCMPAVFDIEDTEISKPEILNILNEISSATKCVKAVLMDDGAVWMNIETFIDSTPEFKDFFFRLLNILHASRMQLVDAVRQLLKDKEKEA